jgi:hypothetical protein
MRIDHISESHPTLDATKKKARKKERKAKKQKGNFALAQYKKKALLATQKTISRNFATSP